jgi:ArsR family transcriptional regulator
MTDSAVPGSAPGAGLPVGLRPPISEIKAELFKALAHPARIRVLELLAEGERTVGEMQPLVGLESSHLSQQLGVLRRARLVSTRKEGSAVYYSIRDPRLVELLAVAKQLLINSLSESEDLLTDLRNG